ncbi:glyoxylate reductase KNAG_0J01360 [Huiozyma naganishii CBS 8797]|uniref:D-isomer specific 2-hydroxyacid dehydrogenase NAD-binding domain-containing protein n=1 Tax=Huiozyma naganishii (strain ATCC MYA-139 / BCRC 22969 / CBS 8797 / KCTC 17520 / NBRC 10181 / NCYC 3082 / Yp74L-3) TaxID=1071383 RepID=J7S2S7_HUIN7|nr:hypothetical protein KNAG_0J01360 [Kazachstania naganishii CBS 8797]CCK72217.1 hypothetical protein KNAG_0J01360 [Kazachstania naganishii CBS 8797]
MTNDSVKIVIPYRLQWELDDSLPLWKELEDKHGVEFIRYKMTTADEFRKWLRGSELSAVWITEEFCSILGGPSEFLNDFPSTLKAVLVPWVGIDYVLNKEQCALLRKERDVNVVNVGPNAANSVCEMALYLVLSVFRMTSFWEYLIKFVEFGKVMNCRDYLGTEIDDVEDLQLICKNGSEKIINHYQFPKKLKPSEDGEIVDVVQKFQIGGKKIVSPMGKTALLLGFGSIGQTIAKKLHLAFDMKIQYHKRSGPLSEEQLGFKAEFVPDLEDAKSWSEADIIVMALPGNATTDDIINYKTLAMCKDGVRVVNVGRGSCIDEDALLRALKSGKVASCGLDVFKNESTSIRKDFIQRWDVTALPHMGSAVMDMMSLQTLITLQNAEDIFVKGGKGVYPVN